MNQTLLKTLVIYNPISGLFINKITRSVNGKAIVGTIAGNKTCTGYWYIRVAGKRYPAHRLAFLYMTGNWPKYQIDHINNNRLDNRWENLREATPAENARNVSMFCSNTSGFKGVGLNNKSKTKPWRARISVNKKSISLGYFATAEEAFEAYKKAAEFYHKEFAKYV